MGKRKERRLAAKTTANRRVKLDLLAEPSGDFGDSANKEEAGGAGNGKNHAGSPNSPSSSEFQHLSKISDQRPENPLLLLGQYIDEEVEEDLGKEISDDRENTPAELDEEVKIANHQGTRENEDENLTTEKVDQENKEHSSSLDVLPKLEENGTIEDSKIKSPHTDTGALEQASIPLTSDIHTTGDVELGWKMVLHEESNSYYYWNMVTGETSWEVPAVLTQGNESAYNPKSDPEVEETHITSVDTQPNNGSTDGMVFEASIDVSRPELEVHYEKYTHLMTNDEDEGNHAKTTDGRKMASPDDVSYGLANVDALSNGVAHNADSIIQDVSDHVYQTSLGDPSSDSFRLLQLGENLSERLNTLRGSEGFSDQISKLTFELDIRLGDIKSLVPYGSSLLPFWLHSENQLKKLEASINNEFLKCSQPTNIGEINESEKNLQDNVPAHEKNLVSTSLQSGACNQAAPRVCPENAAQGETLAHGNAIPADVGLQSVEEEDMDVEMEVEDSVPFGDELGARNRAQTDEYIPHGQNKSHGSEEEFGIPPPPNDEWIPPPPPDDEPLPPPPPDELSEPPLPPLPSEIQTAQPYSHEEQYSFTYPGPGFEYYGQTNTQVPSNNYYVDANGCQVAVAAPLPVAYYAAVPNPYPDGTSTMNRIDPVTYYALQEGSAPTAPIICSVETSGLQKSVLESIAPDQTEAVTEVPFTLASARAPANSSVTRDVSVLSAPSVATTEPVPKVQPKVSRNKKRTVAAVPTLRSNKKVSGLVDKWKAVKEELHEDEEDEPETAYEILEKKRQREIEQWHAQQIASGEAKDNANFQPLGGDWRERVRRKRAKQLTEVEENLAKPFDDTNQQPHLVELSKQLPAGWQAYWDEASKQVYYGNSTTSETTWTKPF